EEYASVASAESESTAQPAGTATATLTNRRLLSRLRGFVRTDAASATMQDRRLSDEAFTAGLAAQKHLLRGLFTADATINNGTLELQSSSRGLLEDVQLLLLGFGVQSAIVHERPNASVGSASADGISQSSVL